MIVGTIAVVIVSTIAIATIAVGRIIVIGFVVVKANATVMIAETINK